MSLALLAAAAWVLRDVLLSGGALVPGAPSTDLGAQFLAWRDYGFSELSKGNIPLWNPHLFCGIPFLAGFESALLYPPNWIHFLLSAGAAVNATILFHLWLTGAGTRAWLRARGRGEAAALAGAALFMFCGPVFLRLYAGHLPVICALAWAPLVFWAVETKSARAGMAVVAMQVLAGNPQYAYFTALAAATYAAFRGSLRELAWMYAGGLALSAPQWLPGLAALPDSVRADASFEFAGRFALPARGLATLVVPHLFGDASTYSGPSFYWEASLAFGALGTALAAFACARPSKDDRPLLWIGAAALLLSLGAATPLYKIAYLTIPGLSSLRGIGKLSFVFCLCLSALAAAGVDRAAARFKPAAMTAWVLAALVLVQSLWFASANRVSMRAGWLYPDEWRQTLSKLAPGERVLHDITRFPNASLVLRQSDVWGYSALAPRRLAELLAAAQGYPWRHATQYLPWKKDAPALLDLLRCRVVFPALPGGKPAALRGNPLPRALFVPEWTVMPRTETALKALTAPGFDPRKLVVLERDPGLAPQRKTTTHVAVTEEPGGVFIVDADRPGILLVTDSYAEGWRAEALPGSSAARYDVAPADHAVIGIPLAPGRHRLRLVYRPWTFGAGAWIALLAAAALLVSWGRGRLLRHRQRPS